MDTAPIVARLKAQLVGWVQIGGAAELDTAIEGTPNVPAAFVVPLAESFAKPALLGVHQQRFTAGFGVVIVVQNLRDPLGAAASSELQVRRLQVRTALLGWPANAAGFPVCATGGRILRFDQGRLWWADEFSVDDYYRSA